MNALLERLDDDALALAIAPLNTVESIQAVLRRAPQVLEVRRAVQDGTLAPTTLREWVESCMQRFTRGERFHHETALCALAVAFETCATPFAQEFLEELATVNVREMPLSPGIAARSAHSRRRLLSRTPSRRGPPRHS